MRHLEPHQRTRLEALVQEFVDEVHWEGRGGLEVTEAMRISVAAQACRLILGLPSNAYRWVKTIYLFPSTYTAESQVIGEGGQVQDSLSHRHGEAWLRGPVVLSWNAARLGIANPDDGRNVVYHEFAHKLDMLDRFADGTPGLDDQSDLEAWTRIMGQEFEDLVQAKQRGKKTLLDKYGATKPAEFFAVATEAFFERPKRLRKRHKELYACLCRFYRQNPARREVWDPESR